MLWTMTDNVSLYYDGVCAWLIYGRKGSLTRCETLVPLEKPPGPDYGCPTTMRPKLLPIALIGS